MCTPVGSDPDGVGHFREEQHGHEDRQQLLDSATSFSMAYIFLYMFLIPVLEKLKIFCRYISYTNQNTHRINQNCMVKCKAEYLKY